MQTIESTREKDETVVSLDDVEVEADEAQDEFAGTSHKCVIGPGMCNIKLWLCSCGISGQHVRYMVALQFTSHLSGAEHIQRVRPPNVLLTTCYKPSGIMYKFLAEMLEVLPCATYYKRQVLGNSLCL